MKKMILAALVAVVSVSANAQYWVGGEVGLGTSKTTNNGNELAKKNAVVLAPEFGVTLSDNWDAAIALRYTHSDSKGGDNTNTFSFNPYVRYTYLRSGDFSAFVDGGFSYGLSHTSGVEDNVNTWKIGINPGFAYALSEKVSLVAHVGDLSWAFAKQGDTKRNAFNLDVTNAISFGAYVSF